MTSPPRNGKPPYLAVRGGNSIPNPLTTIQSLAQTVIGYKGKRDLEVTIWRVRQ